MLKKKHVNIFLDIYKLTCMISHSYNWEPKSANEWPNKGHSHPTKHVSDAKMWLTQPKGFGHRWYDMRSCIQFFPPFQKKKKKNLPANIFGYTLTL